MIKAGDLIKETLKGKSLYRVLFNWQVAKHCQGLGGVCVDLACGKKTASYHRYWQIKPEQMIRIDAGRETEADLVADLNQGVPLADNLADNVFLFNALYLIKEPGALLSEIRRILKPGVQAFITFQFLKSEESQVADRHRFTSYQAKQLLNGAGFDLVRVFPVGERFSVVGELADFALGNFFISNLIKIFLRPMFLAADKLSPKKLKANYPCALAWFAIVQK